VFVLGESEPDIPRGPISFRATTRFTPVRSGPHIVGMTEVGSARLFLDGKLLFDGIATPTPRGDAYFGTASQELTTEVDLDAEGDGHEIVIEFASVRKGWLQGVVVGCKAVPSVDMMDRAVAAAAAADAAIVIVGTNNDWETEGHDRDSLDLPGAQGELIERVAVANPNTVVVLNTGSVVTTEWAQEAPAILQAWFGGQEMSNALVDVLFGDSEPSGRLPTTFPDCIEHTPSFGNFPGEHGQVRYGEGVLMGYRWYEARHLPVRYAFGHGISYTEFAIGAPEAPSTYSAAADGSSAPLTITVPVTNTGRRRGAEVVQCYVGQRRPAVVRPPKELKAFQKVWLEPGESTTVTLTLDGRSFAYWDPGSRYKGSLMTDAVGNFAATPDADPGWRIDAGTYDIYIGRASDDIAHTVAVDSRTHLVYFPLARGATGRPQLLVMRPR